MPWGAIFKIEFTDLKSSAPQKREIRPDYFIVTDDRIVLLNEEDNEAAVKKISALDKPPEFGPGDIYEIATGKFSHEDGLWKTTISLKGDLCVYDSSHPSGHFKKIVWKKGVGLVECQRLRREERWVSLQARKVRATANCGHQVRSDVDLSIDNQRQI